MILRLEQYLARAAGGTGVIPESPETNTEAYLAILAGENRQAPEPVTRLDMYLYNLVGGNYPIPTPNTRIEQYLAKACGLEIEVPTPITREEQLWYAIANLSWQLTTLTGALPLSFKSKGAALTDYKIYGTSDGAGVETESGEPTGYKLPMTMENGNTENLAPALSQWGNGYVSVNGAITHIHLYYEEKFSTFIEIKPNAVYLFGIDGNAFPTGSGGAWLGIGLYDDEQHFIKRVTSTSTNPYIFSTPSNAKYVRLSYRSYGELWEPMLNERSFSTPIYIGDSKLGAEEYVDYESGKIYREVGGVLTPTDPPVPLPELSTYSGENTLSCSETLGEVSITGYIKEAGNG